MTRHDTPINPNHKYFHSLFAATALLFALALPGCSQGTVHAHVDAIDLREESLPGGELQSINGTYGAGCTNRTGDWSLEVAEDAVLDNDELSVVMNDDGCVLTLTELHTSEGVLAAEPAIVLTAAYKATASEFDDPVLFYGNAKLDSVSFAADFVLTLLYSEDPSLAGDDNTAQFEVVESSVQGDSVAVPDYEIDTNTLLLLTDLDQIVQSASGNVGLTAGMVTGQTYAVVDAVGLDAYDEVDAAYLAATPAALGANIPAAKFDLVGEDLDLAVKRTLIIANIEHGVASYQAFEITFHPAVVD